MYHFHEILIRFEARCEQHGIPPQSNAPGRSRSVSLTATRNPGVDVKSLSGPRWATSYHCLRVNPIKSERERERERERDREIERERER